MGFGYIEKQCLLCNEITDHSVRKHYSPKNGMRRTVVKCLQCQTKEITKNNNRRYTKWGHRDY
jgi:hypothetical protein